MANTLPEFMADLVGQPPTERDVRAPKSHVTNLLRVRAELHARLARIERRIRLLSGKGTVRNVSMGRRRATRVR
jgi:hypothetical protein